MTAKKYLCKIGLHEWRNIGTNFKMQLNYYDCANCDKMRVADFTRKRKAVFARLP